MTSTPLRIRFSRPRRPVRAAAVLLAMLFVLLRPVCDVFAATGEGDARGVIASQSGQAFTAASDHHTDHGICCTSVAADTLSVPAALLPVAAFFGDLALSSGIASRALASHSRPARFVARRDPPPPRPYHARSQRRLD